MKKSYARYQPKPRVQATVISETPFMAPNTQINPLANTALLNLFGGSPTGITGLPGTGLGINPGLGTGLGLATTLGLGALSGGVPALGSGASAGAFGALPGISPFGASLGL